MASSRRVPETRRSCRERPEYRKRNRCPGHPVSGISKLPELRTQDGAEERLFANAIVSAVGQLNRPHIPDFPGRERSLDHRSR